MINVNAAVLSVVGAILAGVTYCPCCKSANAQFARPKVPDGLPAKVTICGICTRHLGDGPRTRDQREREHFEQWQEDIELLKQRHADELAARDGLVAELRTKIANLERELRTRPVQVVRENLDQQTVDQAKSDRDAAFRARDAAYRLVAEFRRLHHDTGKGMCLCRVAGDKCPVTMILNAHRGFLRWEAREWRTVRDHGRYASNLPPGHPALTNPRWSPPESPQT
jgi:hypothetical protein